MYTLVDEMVSYGCTKGDFLPCLGSIVVYHPSSVLFVFPGILRKKVKHKRHGLGGEIPLAPRKF